MDRQYLYFVRLYTMNLNNAYFVINWTKSNTKIRRLYSHPVDKDSGLICDQTIWLSGSYTSKDYPEKLRRIKYFDSEASKTFVFLTQNKVLSCPNGYRIMSLSLAGGTVFLMVKTESAYQSILRNKRKCGKESGLDRGFGLFDSGNHKKCMNLDISFYTMLQILSITVFNETLLLQLFTNNSYENKITTNDNYLK